MTAAAYQIRNEPPRWLVERAQVLLARGYSAKRVAELVEIPESYAKLMKDKGLF